MNGGDNKTKQNKTYKVRDGLLFFERGGGGGVEKFSGHEFFSHLEVWHDFFCGQ